MHKGRIVSGWGCPPPDKRSRQSIPRDVDNRTTGWVNEDEHRVQTVERRGAWPEDSGDWPEDSARERPRDRQRVPSRDFQSKYGFK